jgi:hypothetical protein
MDIPFSLGANATDKLCLTSKILSPLDDVPDVEISIENSRPNGLPECQRADCPRITLTGYLALPSNPLG